MYSSLLFFPAFTSARNRLACRIKLSTPTNGSRSSSTLGVLKNRNAIFELFEQGFDEVQSSYSSRCAGRWRVQSLELFSIHVQLRRTRKRFHTPKTWRTPPDATHSQAAYAAREANECCCRGFLRRHPRRSRWTLRRNLRDSRSGYSDPNLAARRAETSVIAGFQGSSHLQQGKKRFQIRAREPYSESRVVGARSRMYRSQFL